LEFGGIGLLKKAYMGGSFLPLNVLKFIENLKPPFRQPLFLPLL
jgi:hypothetical protein